MAKFFFLKIVPRKNLFKKILAFLFFFWARGRGFFMEKPSPPSGFFLIFFSGLLGGPPLKYSPFPYLQTQNIKWESENSSNFGFKFMTKWVVF